MCQQLSLGVLIPCLVWQLPIAVRAVPPVLVELARPGLAWPGQGGRLAACQADRVMWSFAELDAELEAVGPWQHQALIFQKRLEVYSRQPAQRACRLCRLHVLWA